MVVLGQNECIQEKWLSSVKVIVFGQKMVEFEKTCKYLGKNGFIRAKWMYLGKSGCIQAKWLYSGKSCVIREKWLYSGKSVFIPAKWLYSR